MNRRLFQRFAFWLLPLLLARAFVPAGFMVSTGASGLELTFCTTQAPVFAGSPTGPSMGHGSMDHGSTDQGMDHAMHEHAGHEMPPGGSAVTPDPHAAHHAGKHFDSPCPFGVAATAIATDLPPVSLATLVAAIGTFKFTSAPTVSVGPLRSDRIRGPPLFS